MTYPDAAGKDFSYLTGLKWRTTDRWLIEREMIQHGGKVRVKGKDYGEGIAHHYKAAITQRRRKRRSRWASGTWIGRWSLKSNG